MSQTVVVTGANGFIGRALWSYFAQSGIACRAVLRTADSSFPFHCGHTPIVPFVAGDLAQTAEARLDAIVNGAGAVVHLAGRAHVLRETAADAARLAHSANVVATRRLARAAARAGVRRFVFTSTIKVHGEATLPGKLFRAADPYAPEDDYARSKVEAERALIEACAGTTMLPQIFRLPLVYGPGVKGNFLFLLEAVARRQVLPLGAIRNRRHLLYVGNLVHVLAKSIMSEPPLTGPWLFADGEALSTPQLVRRLGAALSVSPRLWSVPVPLLSVMAALLSRRAMLRRLTGSLEVDATPLRQRIGDPPFIVEEGFRETAVWWRMSRQSARQSEMVQA